MGWGVERVVNMGSTFRMSWLSREMSSEPPCDIIFKCRIIIKLRRYRYFMLLCWIDGKNTNEQYFQQIETLYLAETYSGTRLNFCLSNLSERSFVMATHTYPKSIWILCRSPNLINNSNESFPLSTQHVPQEHTTMVQLLRNSSICIVYIVTSHHLYSKDTKKELPYRKVENWFPIIFLQI